MSNETIPPFYMVPLQRLSLYRETPEADKFSDKLSITLLGESMISFTAFVGGDMIKAIFYNINFQSLVATVQATDPELTPNPAFVYHISKVKKGYEGGQDEKMEVEVGRVEDGRLYISISNNGKSSDKFYFENFKGNEFKHNGVDVELPKVSRTMFDTWLDSLDKSIEGNSALITWTTKITKPGTPKKSYNNNNNSGYSAPQNNGGGTTDDYTDDIPF